MDGFKDGFHKGKLLASMVLVDTGGFSGNLSSADYTVQIALNTLDAILGLPGASKTTLLSIIGAKVSGSTYSVAASGVNYTMSGDVGDLDTAINFLAKPRIEIYLNGVLQRKGADVVWASSATFVLNRATDNGDELIIFS